MAEGDRQDQGSAEDADQDQGVRVRVDVGGWISGPCLGGPAARLTAAQGRPLPERRAQGRPLPERGSGGTVGEIAETAS